MIRLVALFTFLFGFAIDGSLARGDNKTPPPAAQLAPPLAAIRKQVDDQLDHALQALDNQNIPAPVRAKLKERLGRVRSKVDARLSHLKLDDLDHLDDELDALGDEIGNEMEAFGSDMEQWGQQFGQQLEQQLKQQGVAAHIRVHPTVPRVVMPDGDDDDDDDLTDAIRDLGDLDLKPAQRTAIAKLRTDSDKQVAAAKQALATAEKTLHDQLAAGTASDADIGKSIDAVTQHEAAIRKARILAWVNARRMLDDAQRKRVEGAAAKGATK